MKQNTTKHFAKFLLPLALVVTTALTGCSTTTKSGQATFRKPADAVNALSALIDSGDSARTVEIFGAGGAELLSSGDEIADRNAAEDVKALIQEKVAFEDVGETTKVVVLGNEDWPFAIPLEKDGRRWYFDSAAGAEDLENRRIGRNELSTLATLHAMVDAQREYLGSEGRRRTYARKIVSSPGKKDGLYWHTEEGEKPSPLGPLVAEATSEGYAEPGAEPQPYHGYNFRMLTGQGENAPGGKKSYLDRKGAMTRGFAVLAWPARYGHSGVMTLVVGPEGVVFQKDLGEQTLKSASAIESFDPDASWAPTGD